VSCSDVEERGELVIGEEQRVSARGVRVKVDDVKSREFAGEERVECI
jgi:hypothetical protein